MAEPVPAVLPDDYKVEEQVGFLLRRANQRHTNIFLEGMATADLTPTQFTALLKTVEMRCVTQNQLGRLASMDPATILGVVRRLLARRLIERNPAPVDRRTVELVPTEAGIALIARALVPARKITEATLAPLTPAQRRQFIGLLRKLT